MKMLEVPATERPRERCLEKGARSLSIRECLALILNSGPKGKGSLGLSLEILDRPGTGMDEAALCSRLDACLVDEKEGMHLAAWSKLIDRFPKWKRADEAA